MPPWRACNCAQFSIFVCCLRKTKTNREIAPKKMSTCFLQQFFGHDHVHLVLAGWFSTLATIIITYYEWRARLQRCLCCTLSLTVWLSSSRTVILFEKFISFQINFLHCAFATRKQSRFTSIARTQCVRFLCALVLVLVFGAFLLFCNVRNVSSTQRIHTIASMFLIYLGADLWQRIGKLWFGIKSFHLSSKSNRGNFDQAEKKTKKSCEGGYSRRNEK